MIQKIITQGHFDGFCLIYSIFNAYKSLRKPDVKANDFVWGHSKQWAKVISVTPSLQNFASGKGSDFGVSKNVTDEKLKRSFLKTCLDVITEDTRVDAMVASIDIKSLNTVDFSHSVVVLCVKETSVFELGGMGDHWVVIVGRDESQGRYLVACSNTLHQYGFHERVDTQNGRVYNTTIEIKGIKKSTVYPESISEVTIVAR
ncbi:hypothetical protein [Pseudomonas silensiensis]|uniref:hypothetical protein n=1 Tax=Pseudomonas silensiensis TaxID=2991049 RepID=UPI003D210C32